jgi:DNA-binding GntR family transcriptional regulator
MSSIYQDVHAFVSQETKAKRLHANQKLPSERQLLEQFGSTRITIREALFRLESEGTIYRQVRKGWFLATPRLIIDPTHKVDFNLLAQQQSRVPNTQLIHVKRVRPIAKIRNVLQLDQPGSVFEVRRIRLLDQRIILMENIYIDAVRFEGFNKMDLSGSTTSALLEHYQVRIDNEHSKVRVEALNDTQAQCLSLNPGMPCLNIRRIRYDKSHSPVDYCVEYWLHNAVELDIKTS